MIVFLTLIYVALLAVLVKVGVVKLNLFWKLSPGLWMVLLFVVLFMPMQWGAPGGPVNVYQYVVEIVPDVSGTVVDVPAEPAKTVQEGDVLFRIEAEPYQARVDQLTAQLAATIQNVEVLNAAAEASDANVKKIEEEINIKKSDIEVAAAKVEVAESSVSQAKIGVDKANQNVEDIRVQVAAAKRELDRQKELLAQGAGSQSALDRVQIQYTSLDNSLNTAESDLRSARETLTSAESDLSASQAAKRSEELSLTMKVDAELPRAQAESRQAHLEADSMIGDEHTSVANVRAQLESAKFDLEKTVVRAPSKGHVVGLTLRPGQRVASLPMRSWMAFVDHKQTEVVVAIKQYALRHVRPGQKAEVTFNLFPGEVYDATVVRVIYSSESGQLQASGIMESLVPDFQETDPYGVVLQLEDPEVSKAVLVGGASGSAAIYTESVKATHVIRRVMIRMDAWMNYIIP